MLIRLQDYDFELVYRPGSQVIFADTQSRAFSPTETETSFHMVTALTTVDAEQTADVRMISSDDTLALTESAAEDNEYIRLQQIFR